MASPQTVSELLEQQDDDFIDVAEMLKNNPLLQDLDLSGTKDESSQRLIRSKPLAESQGSMCDSQASSSTTC